MKIVFLETSQNLQENNCAKVSFLKSSPATVQIKKPWHRCFPVNFAKFLRSVIAMFRILRVKLKRKASLD